MEENKFSPEKIAKRFSQVSARAVIEGAFPDIPTEAYNHSEFPGVRSSSLKKICSHSVAHAELAVTLKKTDALRIGSAFHAAMAGESLIPYDLTSPEGILVGLLKSRVTNHPDVIDLMSGALSEFTFFSRDEATGLQKRCRADLWNPATRQVSDYKTCDDASPDAFARDSKKFGYRLSAAFYLEVISECISMQVDRFNIIAVEKKPPYEVAVYFYERDQLTPEFELIRLGMDRIKRASTGGNRGYDHGPKRMKF